MSDLANRLNAIKARIREAAVRAGRAPEGVRLLAVSKLQPEQAIRDAYALGQRDFGENYAQELRDKAKNLADLTELRWHAIGPLQTNKAKYVAKAASVFHALDRLEVAQALSKLRTGAPLRCFLEVNIGAETSKGGVGASEVEALRDSVAKLPGLEVVGLMCLPPLGTASEQSRPHFQAVRELARRLGLPELSMGTTSDFEVAIEEGSTMVRVGTAIFGERD
jgi:pyridoxal phosphate enzyme (YggS family)